MMYKIFCLYQITNNYAIGIAFALLNRGIIYILVFKFSIKSTRVSSKESSGAGPKLCFLLFPIVICHRNAVVKL